MDADAPMTPTIGKTYYVRIMSIWVMQCVALVDGKEEALMCAPGSDSVSTYRFDQIIAEKVFVASAPEAAQRDDDDDSLFGACNGFLASILGRSGRRR